MYKPDTVVVNVVLREGWTGLCVKLSPPLTGDTLSRGSVVKSVVQYTTFPSSFVTIVHTDEPPAKIEDGEHDIVDVESG